MSPKIKTHLYSAGITFVSAFLLALGTSLAAHTGVDLSGTLVVSLLISAARSAGKILFENLLKTDVLLGVKQ